MTRRPLLSVPLLLALGCLRQAGGPAPGAPSPLLEPEPPASTQPRGFAPPTSARRPREYLVTVSFGAGSGPIREAFAQQGVERVEQVGQDAFLLVVAKDPGPERMEEIRKVHLRVLRVRPSFVEAH